MSRHVLDELFDEVVYEQLRAKRLAIDTVGTGFGESGWLDERILQALQGSGKTFHTRDQGCYRRSRCHPSYCLIWYDLPVAETAL